MNKVIIIALVFVTIGFCDNMMMRAGSGANDKFRDAFSQYFSSAKISLQKLLKDAYMTCTEISSIEMLQYDFNLDCYPLISVAAELNINNGGCKIEALALYYAVDKSFYISKLYKEYPPFKKLADLPK
jgi:hypothetical protein